MLVLTSETLECALLLGKGQTIAKAGEVELGGDFRIKTSQYLTHDMPAYPMLPNSADSVLEQGADLGPEKIWIEVARWGESMCLIRGGRC